MQPGVNMTIDMDLDFDAESFSGTTGFGDFGSFDISGNKIGEPEHK